VLDNPYLMLFLARHNTKLHYALKAKRETDKLAGRRARLFVRGESRWEIEFLRTRQKTEDRDGGER
jgi:hypothetical protein